MICPDCREAADVYDHAKPVGGFTEERLRRAGRELHLSCRGRSHCDCQHEIQPTRTTETEVTR